MFQTIYADPPWDYKKPGSQHGMRIPYPCLSTDKIAAMPIKELTAKNSHLYLWFTNPFCEDAYKVARSWGFKPKTILTWCKMKMDGSRPSMSRGNWYLSASEHILFCVKGKLNLKGPSRPTAYCLPREEKHSVKPDFFYDLIEEQSPGPFLELFARRPRTGWRQWGNEI